MSLARPDGSDFWRNLDRLLDEGEIVIDRPKGSAHPRLQRVIYPLDYGYITGTSAADGDGVDVWRGSDRAGAFDAVVCTVDPDKRDVEVKVLLGCTPAEKQVIVRFHAGAMLVNRPAASGAGGG